MAAKYRKPCFDSSVFLGGLNKEIHQGIKRGVVFDFLWQKARDGEFKVFIATLTLAEVYKKKGVPKPADAVLDEFLECINETFVEAIELDRETGLLAHRLCRQFADRKLQPNDAIQLACALRAKCDALFAWDRPLLLVKHPDIEIVEPAMFDRDLLTPSEMATPEEIDAYNLAVGGGPKNEEKSDLSSSTQIQGSRGRPTQG